MFNVILARWKWPIWRMVRAKFKADEKMNNAAQFVVTKEELAVAATQTTITITSIGEKSTAVSSRVQAGHNNQLLKKRLSITNNKNIDTKMEEEEDLAT